MGFHIFNVKKYFPKVLIQSQIGSIFPVFPFSNPKLACFWRMQFRSWSAGSFSAFRLANCSAAVQIYSFLHLSFCSNFYVVCRFQFVSFLHTVHSMKKYSACVWMLRFGTQRLHSAGYTANEFTPSSGQVFWGISKLIMVPFQKYIFSPIWASKHFKRSGVFRNLTPPRFDHFHLHIKLILNKPLEQNVAVERAQTLLMCLAFCHACLSRNFIMMRNEEIKEKGERPIHPFYAFSHCLTNISSYTGY